MFVHAFLLRFTVFVSCLQAHLQHTNAHSRHLKFPPHFKFGAATSSYQIEGGWNEDGKGVSIWDRFSHARPSTIKGNATGDVAADSYHRWRDDVRVAAEMGLHFYRFSIAWPRILPSGFNNEINEAGVRYYSDLIDALLANGIEPVITMYHWELPVAIQDMGGWTNPLIVKWFGDYARVIFSLYADRVKTWITINEAIVVCDFNYNIGNFAPGIREPEFAPYLCNKHVLLAHATAYKIYSQEFKEQYNGKLSLANNMLWVEPASPDDLELAELGRQHSMGRYLHPMLSKKGGWPPNTEKAMLEYSLKKGYNESKLPSFTYEERKFIRGTIDFISINYYTTSVIRPAKEGETIGEWFLTGSRELNAVITSPEDSYFGVSPILAVYPQGLRRQLNWLKGQYGDVEMLITENGFSTGGGRLDRDRIHFIHEHLQQVLLAIKDGVRVIGYSVWSMIDNFEWNDGYSTKFGLYEVDFESVEKVRTPRASAHYYSCVIQKHALNSSCLVRHHHLYLQNSATLSSSGLLTVILLVIIALW